MLVEFGKFELLLYDLIPIFISIIMIDKYLFFVAVGFCKREASSNTYSSFSAKLIVVIFILYSYFKVRPYRPGTTTARDETLVVALPKSLPNANAPALAPLP